MEEKFVINWFCEKGVLEEELNENIKSNYLECGYLDSLGFIELISACEEEFNIEFGEDDFLNDEIFSIDGLARAIKGKNNG